MEKGGLSSPICYRNDYVCDDEKTTCGLGFDYEGESEPKIRGSLVMIKYGSVFIVYLSMLRLKVSIIKW